LAEPAVPPAPRWLGSATRRLWTIALGGTVVAVALAVAVLPSAAEPLRPVAVLVIAALFLISESIEMHVEFRRQTYSWSLAELALVIGLVEVGGLWTTIAWVVALAIQLTVQSYSPAKAVFNVAMALLLLATLVPMLA
jgi:hypothetical protein